MLLALGSGNGFINVKATLNILERFLTLIKSPNVCFINTEECNRALS